MALLGMLQMLSFVLLCALCTGAHAAYDNSYGMSFNRREIQIGTSDGVAQLFYNIFFFSF